ncbi:hypothetical protein NMG60_11006252 [Bertholletia excelsa]
MASFALLSNNGILITQERLRVYSGKSKLLGRNRSISCSFSSYCPSAAPFQYLGFRSCCNSRNILLCNTKIRSVINKNCENNETHLGRRENVGMRKKFSLRLRPRLRLLSSRLKRVSVRSILNDLGMFLQKNMRKVTISTSVSLALGLCYLFLKLTATASPKVVPYSDLIMSLKNGTVDSVLFEEGSRRLYFNTGSCNTEKSLTSEDKSVPINSQEGNAVEKSGSKGSNVFRKLTGTRNSTPCGSFLLEG